MKLIYILAKLYLIKSGEYETKIKPSKIKDKINKQFYSSENR